MVLVTLACVMRLWNLTSTFVNKLQRSEVDMRKKLEGALISLDSLQNAVALTHICAVGILLAVFPGLSP